MGMILLMIVVLLGRITLCIVSPPEVEHISTSKPSSVSIGAGTDDRTFDPTVVAVGSGDLIDLSITVYNETKCKGSAARFSVAFSEKNPWQVQSYRLSRDLCPNEVLDFWNAFPEGGPLNPVDDGNNASCSSYIRKAGGDERKKSCTTLKEPMGCMRVSLQATVSQAAKNGSPSLQTDVPGSCMQSK